MRLADLLDPSPAAPAPVVTPGRVGGRAAWADLVRSGALHLLRDEAAVPAGTRVGPEHRALALAGEVPRRCVLAARTAAWVHTGLTALRDGEPASPGQARPALPHDTALEVAYATGTHPPAPRPGLVPRQVLRLAPDTVRVAGVAVTSPARTALDVACTVPHEAAVTLLVALARTGVDLAAVSRSLELRGRVPGRPAARRALAAATRRHAR